MATNIPQGWSDLTRKHWSTLAQGAVFVLGVVSTFLLPPPTGAASESNVWSHLAKFVVAVLIGLMIVLSRKLRARRYVNLWWGVSLALLIASVAAFFGYQHLTSERTCRYFDQTVVIGSELTPQAREFVEHDPAARDTANRCAAMLDAFPGEAEETLEARAEQIWTSESVERSRRLLAVTYLSCLPLFTICLISTVQAVACLDANRRN